MITLTFSIDEINQILSLLGQMPFAQSNTTIGKIIAQAQPQADAIEQAAKEVPAAE